MLFAFAAARLRKSFSGLLIVRVKGENETEKNPPSQEMAIVMIIANRNSFLNKILMLDVKS